jgi:hypothetical protein
MSRLRYRPPAVGLATDRLKAVQFRYSPRGSAPQAMPGRRYGCRWAKLIGLSEQIRYIAGRLAGAGFNIAGSLSRQLISVFPLCCARVSSNSPWQPSHQKAIARPSRRLDGWGRAAAGAATGTSTTVTVVDGASPPRSNTVTRPWPNAPGRRWHLKTFPRKTTGSAGRGRPVRRRGGRHKRGSISSA